MAYFKIDGVDFSHCVSSLKVSTEANYNAQTNAAGNTVVDYVNSKRTIEVGIIPVDGETMAQLKAVISAFSVAISFRNPDTNSLTEDVPCIIPDNEVDYYTIQANRVSYNPFTLTFVEL
jgi:hypothetical protein